MSWLFQRGDWWYIGDYKSDGTPFQKSLKTTDRKTAEDYRINHDYAKSRGRLGLLNDRKTYADYKLEHADYVSQFGEKTQGIYADALKTFERLVSLPDLLIEITPSMAQEWLNKRRRELASRRDTVMSPTSINIALRSLRAFFNHAVEVNLIHESPFAHVKDMKVVKTFKNEEHEYLNREQVDILMKAVEPNFELNKLAHLYLYAGLRLQEATHQRWQDQMFGRHMIQVKGWGGWTLKDYEDRELPQHRKLFQILEKSPKDSELVCPGKYGVRNATSVDQAFNRIWARTGLPFRGVHVLRHTFITHTVNSGVVPATMVQAWVGHASIKTTEGYIHKDRSRWHHAMGNFDFGGTPPATALTLEKAEYLQTGVSSVD